MLTLLRLSYNDSRGGHTSPRVHTAPVGDHPPRGPWRFDAGSSDGVVANGGNCGIGFRASSPCIHPEPARPPRLSSNRFAVRMTGSGSVALELCTVCWFL